MARRALTLFAIVAVSVVPTTLSAQEDPAAARYEAAIDWFELVAVEADYAAAAARAHPSVASQLTAETLEGAWGQLSGQLGALDSLEPRQQVVQQGMHVVILTGVFAAGTFDVQVVMDDDHAVAGFFVRPPGG